jgi:hypothetical protein
MGDLRGRKLEGGLISLQYLGMDAVFSLFNKPITKCLPCHISRSAEAREMRKLRKAKSKAMIQEKVNLI